VAVIRGHAVEAVVLLGGGSRGAAEDARNRAGSACQITQLLIMEYWLNFLLANSPKENSDGPS
jgi:hypothetical protein